MQTSQAISLKFFSEELNQTILLHSSFTFDYMKFSILASQYLDIAVQQRPK